MAPRYSRCDFHRFRWVELQLVQLKKCSSLLALTEQLSNLPNGLDETYDRVLSKLDDNDHGDIHVFLQWLAFSTRTLDLEELAEVVAVDFSDDESPKYAPERRYQDIRDVLEKCSGLVITIDDENAVKLAHFSVKEYLLSKKIKEGSWRHFAINEQLAHSLISRTCLVHLLEAGKAPFRDPLDRYAAKHWVSHANSVTSASDINSNLSRLIVDFFRSDNAVAHWRTLYNIDMQRGWRMRGLRNTPMPMPIYFAALVGFEVAVTQLIRDGVNLNVIGGNQGTALAVASAEGHTNIVKVLVDGGANVNAQGGFYKNALYAALHHNYEGIVKLLVDGGADVNAQGGFYGNALQAASHRGHEGIVKLLVDGGADVNAQGGEYGNALQAASHRGYEGIVKLLVDGGADVNAQGGKYGNALQAALYRGYEGIVKLLVDGGADVNAQGGFYGNALQAALYRGYEGIVKLLVDGGADVNAQGGQYGNALQAA